jgi:hypothetical protein
MTTPSDSDTAAGPTGLAEPARSFEPSGTLQQQCAALQQRRPACAEELTRACERIDGEPGLSPTDKLRAFARAADAIMDGIKIFISYKSEDEALATSFVEKLADYGAKRLKEDASGNPEIFVAAQNIHGGDDWRQTIKARLAESHWLILLLPDAEIDRDWLVYEAGYFDRGMCKAAGEKLICVHHPNVTLASQLENYQSYSSTADGIRKLFEELFFTADAIAGMHQVAPPFRAKRLAEDARELSLAFRHPRARIEPVFCLRYIDIAHRDGAAYANEQELLEAEVVQAAGLEQVFHRQDDFRGTVGELIADINDEAHGTAWLGALAGALNDVVTGKPPRRMVVPFIGYGENPTVFRPCLHCVRRRGAAGPIDSFHVVFIEEFGGQVGNAPAELDALETTLRWSYRSWWEVIGRYDQRTVRTQEQLDAIRQYTERAEQEAQSRNAMDPALLSRVFAAHPAEQATLDEMQRTYYAKYRNPATGEGKIDQAFRERNPALLGEAISELRPMIAWFLVHGARRYAELLEERLDSELPAERPPSD